MRKKLIVCGLALSGFITSLLPLSGYAESAKNSEKQGAGGFMLTYNYIHMHMNKNQSGTKRVSTADVLKQFQIAPTGMTAQMHMFGAVYMPNQDLYFMAMLPYKILTLDYLMRDGRAFTTKSKGLGDISVSGNYTFYREGMQKFTANMGVSLPTGSIRKRDLIPINPSFKLPFPQQLGSGTYDLLPGVSYSDGNGVCSWGADLNAVVHLGGLNDNKYRLGNQYILGAWRARQLTDVIGASIRVQGVKWDNIHGVDAELDPAAFPLIRNGGKRIDLVPGVNFSLSKHRMSKIVVEATIPVYQNLKGPQLRTSYIINAGWRVSL